MFDLFREWRGGKLISEKGIKSTKENGEKKDPSCLFFPFCFEHFYLTNGFYEGNLFFYIIYHYLVCLFFYYSFVVVVFLLT